VAATPGGHDLGQDGDSNFLWSDRSEVKASGRLDLQGGAFKDAAVKSLTSVAGYP